MPAWRRVDLEAFCDAWFDAWRGNEPEKLAAYYAEDCYYVDPARPQGIVGRDELLRYFRKLLAANPDWAWKRERLDPIHQGFTVTYWAHVPVPTGETLRIKGMDLVLLRDGKIAVNEVHFDTAAWLAALGKTPRRA